jgi:hypothetical protein
MAIKLKKIRISKGMFDRSDSPKYSGEIEFEDSNHEFSFKLDEKRCNQFLHLIREEMISAATELGHKLAESITPINNEECTTSKDN